VSNESGNGKYAPRPGNIPGVAVNLGGLHLVLAPLGLRLMREFEARGKDIKDPEDAVTFNLDVILASLHRNYPDITREELEALLDSQNVQECMTSIFMQSGLQRITPGELKPRA
jgi:hypothetical protein